MTLYDFRLLFEEEQTNLLYNDGVYIGKSWKGSQTVVLYQLDSFYVEVYYKKYRQLISSLRCFTSTDTLTPYLVQIDVEDLMKCMI